MGLDIPNRHQLIERHLASLILETATSLVQCSELSAKMWMPASGGTLYGEDKRSLGRALGRS